MLPLSTNTYCTEDTIVCLDAYSRKFEIKAKREEILFQRVIENINESFSAKQTVSFPGVTKVLDLWCKIKNSNFSFEEGKLMVNGTVTVNALYYESENVPVYAEREIPFEFLKQTNLTEGEFFAEPQVTVMTCSYLLSGEEKAEVKVELGISGAIFECKRLNVLTDIEVNREELPRKKSDCAMAVYFAEKGEKLWDIARNYLADMEEIKNINDVEEDILKSDKALLIPLI